MNWENSAISLILQTSKWMKENHTTGLLPDSIALIRKLTGAYTTLQVIFEDDYTARIKNATPLFLDDFIFDPAPIQAFIEENNNEPVYWKNIAEQDYLFTDILLALSSATLIPVNAGGYRSLIIIGWTEPQPFLSSFQSFAAVIQTRLQEILYQSQLQYLNQKNCSRFYAMLESVPQALVFIDEEGGSGWINNKSAQLLQLSHGGEHEPEILSDAMSSLRNSAINKDEIIKTATAIFTSSDGSIKNWIWKIGAPLNKTLSVSCNPVSTAEIKGKLWIFEGE